MTDPSGLSPKAFDAVDELVTKVSLGELQPEDRRAHSEHPLVVLVESALEALTRQHLKNPIVGFSRGSEERLVIERRRLEHAGEREQFQLLLYAFESVCASLRRNVYGSADQTTSAQYFGEKFPTWMKTLEAWAAAEQYSALQARVSAARSTFDPIAIGLADD